MIYRILLVKVHPLRGLRASICCQLLLHKLTDILRTLSALRFTPCFLNSSRSFSKSIVLMSKSLESLPHGRHQVLLPSDGFIDDAVAQVFLKYFSHVRSVLRYSSSFL